jgi:hypothetical protein
MSDGFEDFGEPQFVALMERMGASEAEARQVLEERREQFEAALATLAEHPLNNPSTVEPRVVVGRYHFRLRSAISTAITLASTLVGAGVALVGFPEISMAAGLTAAAAGATTLEKLSGLAKQMTEMEFYVYTSILDITQNNLPDAKNLTVEKLEHWYERHDYLPIPALEEILESLRDKGIVKSTGYGKDKKYSIVT